MENRQVSQTPTRAHACSQITRAPETEKDRVVAPTLPSSYGSPTLRLLGVCPVASHGAVPHPDEDGRAKHPTDRGYARERKHGHAAETVARGAARRHAASEEHQETASKPEGGREALGGAVGAHRLGREIRAAHRGGEVYDLEVFYSI